MTGISVGDGGDSIIIDNADNTDALGCLLAEPGASQAVVAGMDSTTATMGRQEATSDGLTYRWSYRRPRENQQAYAAGRLDSSQSASVPSWRSAVRCALYPLGSLARPRLCEGRRPGWSPAWPSCSTAPTPRACVESSTKTVAVAYPTPRRAPVKVHLHGWSGGRCTPTCAPRE